MENEPKYVKPLSILVGVLVAVSTVTTLAYIITMNSTYLKTYFDLATCLVVGCYVFFGYKRPRTRMLYWALILFALFQVMDFEGYFRHGLSFLAYGGGVVVGMVCYVAANLHKAKHNAYVLAAALVLLCIVDGIYLFDNVQRIGSFDWMMIGELSGALNCAAIMIAYLVRFKQHEDIKRAAKAAEALGAGRS